MNETMNAAEPVEDVDFCLIWDDEGDPQNSVGWLCRLPNGDCVPVGENVATEWATIQAIGFDFDRWEAEIVVKNRTYDDALDEAKRYARAS